jgi:F-type H+-transporting ATPase subunit gamma
MKAVAAASIGDYERAVTALGDYYETVERGLGACFHAPDLQALQASSIDTQCPPCVIVFGTDQGLVGQFNDTIADFALASLTSLSENSQAVSPSKQPLVWAVGERITERLNDMAITTQAHFDVPNSVRSIAPLIGRILLDIESHHTLSTLTELHLFYNRPGNGSVYHPVTQRLLPLDQHWCSKLAKKAWPTNNIPELLGNTADTLGALVREYLFVSLFRASAESLSSENASRLAAMQRADKNIEELLAMLERDYHRLRQAGIDAEMFDVIAGSTIEKV